MTGGTDHDIAITTPKPASGDVVRRPVQLGTHRLVVGDVVRRPYPLGRWRVIGIEDDQALLSPVQVTDYPITGPWSDEDDREFAPRLLEQERAADRARWRRVDWHPLWTYSSVMIASGWLAGAWYAYTIDGDGARLTICLIGCLSTLWPGIPWQELVSMVRDPARAKIRSIDQ